MQCALGISQLKKNDGFVERRRHIADRYSLNFQDATLIDTPTEQAGIRHSYHLYPLLIDFEKLGKTRNQVMRELRELNIGTQVLYIPLHFQPYYAEKYGYKFGDFQNAEEYYDRCLSIPIFPGMSEKEIDLVIDSVCSIVA